MGAVSHQMVKAVQDVWTYVWTVKQHVNGQVKGAKHPAKKAVKHHVKEDVKVDVRKDVKIAAKDRANLVHKKTLLQVVLEESIFLIQLGVRNPLVYLGGMQVTQMEI